MTLRRSVELHPEAVAEAQAAVEWYRQRNNQAADAFLAELDNAIERITEAPKRQLVFIQGTRRFLLRRFPFAVVYREIGTVIQVLAVAHGRRRPGYWKNR
jgi:plasmid stabilization system protein ParE